MQWKSSRCGMTLIETLVVIFVVSLLVALLLPAVQACREAARASSCANRLAQCALALENHRGLHRIFPEDWDPLAGVPPWSVQSLPYLEAGTLHGRFRPTIGLDSPPNVQLGQLRLPLFECPSASRVELPFDWSPGHFAMNASICGRHAIPDGNSQTIGGFEYAGDPTGWLDLPVLLPGLEDALHTRHRNLHVWLADGSVQRLSPRIDEQLLLALATSEGGEIVQVE